MYVKQFSFVLIVAFICVALAENYSTEDIEVKYEVENVSKDVFHLAKTCSTDSDCHHLGQCVAGSSGKSCKCKTGTSGDFCEKVDECVDNPVKCGTLKDVSCVFDIETEKAVCRCDNDSKTYVEDEERCMSPCLKYDACGEYGFCYHQIGNQKFCACDLGASGDFCEIIDACHNKTVDCGENNNATCKLGPKGNAFCKCDDKTLGFDYDNKICKDCSGCGGKDIAYGTCSYRDGIRLCSCKLRHFSNKMGKCEDCKCGQGSHGCKFENGIKICDCYSWAANKNGSCQKCNCNTAPGFDKCEYKDDKEVCLCREGYTLSAPNGPCKQTCNATSTCKNGGKCVQNTCNCLKGTSGDLCETVNDCQGLAKCGFIKCAYNETAQEAYCKCDGSKLFDADSMTCKEPCSFANPCANGGKCVQNVCSCLKGTSDDFCKTIDDCMGRSKCGYAKCLYNKVTQVAYCKCDGSLVFDDYSHTCRECDCGSFANGCKFVKGKKTCDCPGSWKDRFGICTYCYCLGKSKEDGCTFDNSGMKKCECQKGHTQAGGDCIDCGCGEHGDCGPMKGSKRSCICDDGYADVGGVCKECDCGKYGKCSVDKNGNQTCTCSPGYKEYQGTCKACSCYYDQVCDFDKWGNTQCNCRSGYGKKDGVCTPCNCYPGTSCTFGKTNPYATKEDKKCHCPEGYADNYYGKCSVCDCEAPGSICSYPVGFQHCKCPEGYKEENKRWSMFDKICQDIDECKNSNACPHSSSTNCVNTPGSYHCECKTGYEASSFQDIKQYGCDDINECIRNYKPCTDSSATCVNTPGSYRCACHNGYWFKSSTDEKRNICGAARPWRVATIVAGIISTLIIAGLLIAVVKKCRSS